MSAPTKRRHVSYYLSLPLVVAMVLLVVAQLAALQRADMVADLADRVAHQDGDEATAALRHLAAMPRPPIDVLVSAATSADHAVADEAQYLIGDLLRRWQRQVDSQRRVGTVSRQLGELADALARQQMAFSTSDHAWVRVTTRKILRLANKIPSEKSPLVAAQCDTVLAAVTASEMSAAALVDRRMTLTNAQVTPVQDITSTRSAAGDLDPDFRAYAVRPLTTVGANPAATSVLPGNGEAIAPPASSEQPPVSNTENHTSRTLKWTHPMLNEAPAMPIHAAPVADDAAGGWNRREAEAADEKRSGGSSADGELDPIHPGESPTLDPEQPSTKEHPFTAVDSRKLLDRWLHAHGSDVFPLEEELTRRGFGRLSARLVEQLFSEDAEQRLRLVDDVLTEPGVDARPWLLLLADDAEPDVRLLAVTIMATSDDRALIEKAWHVAIRDRDPRIAGLAGRLRERRESAQRR